MGVAEEAFPVGRVETPHQARILPDRPGLQPAGAQQDDGGAQQRERSELRRLVDQEQGRQGRGDTAADHRRDHNRQPEPQQRGVRGQLVGRQHHEDGQWRAVTDRRERHGGAGEAGDDG